MNVMALTLILMAIAFLLIVCGIALLLLSTVKREGREVRVEGGGVIIVGPLPIVFGTSERIAKGLIILAILLMIIVLAVFLVLSGVVRW